MRKIRDVLRLRHEAGLSQEKVARAVGISKGAVAKYLSLSKAQGLGWPLPDDLDDTALEQLLFPVAKTPVRLVEPDFPTIHQELKRKGVTLHLLWSEYAIAHGERAWRYTQFCHHYKQWRGRQKRSMRQLHRAGEKLFIDYCGPTVPIVDSSTGELREAQVFVAVLGASNDTYAEAIWTQSLPDWIGSHQRPFQKLTGNRKRAFEALDQPALRPLPEQPYEYAEWKQAKPGIDYHVEADKRDDSVPHRWVGQVLDVRVSASVVEVFHKGQRY